MIYIFDVDGTVLSLVPPQQYQLAKPILARILQVNELYDSGHYITYWTGRGSDTGQDWYEYTRAQLLQHGCRFHEFHTRKPHYDIWVDRKAQNAENFFRAT